MAAIMTMDQILHDHSRRCAAEARRLYRDAIRPVFRRTPDGRPELFGSSVLLEVDGVRCVATAAHVLDGHEEASIHIGGREDFLPLNLSFMATTKPNGERSADSIDVAVARLSDSDLKQLGSVSFIKGADQVADFRRGPGHFFLTCGYRASQNKPPRPRKPMPPLKLWTYNGTGAAVPNAETRIARGEYNFALEYPKWARRTEDGVTLKTTSPKGVSGGAVFLLGDLASPEQLGSLHPHRPLLAGIAIECLDQKVLIATKLQAIREALSRAL